MKPAYILCFWFSWWDKIRKKIYIQSYLLTFARKKKLYEVTNVFLENSGFVVSELLDQCLKYFPNFLSANVHTHPWKPWSILFSVPLDFQRRQRRLDSVQDLKFRLGIQHKMTTDQKWASNYFQICYSSIFYSIKPKLDIELFVNFCVFTCFYQFLHDMTIKLFCISKQNNFMITSCKNW